jgi:MoaA/NifB/PqqE/SkfB family radical SAM enzyme
VGAEWLQVDIELTNRCNADCYFCPRDQTPHQGLMTPQIFDQALARAIEFRAVTGPVLGREIVVSLCGLGEPLLNKHAATFARKVKEEGFTCGVATNGALLSEERGSALLDAGLDWIHINAGEQGEQYEEIYKLPWERTRDNIIRFAEMADGRCRVNIVLVDHRGDPEHGEQMRTFWRQHGIREFHGFEIINRGGALAVDHMQYEQFEQLAEARTGFEDRGGLPVCAVPFGFVFVGYDGQYYLCCSDWKKEVPLGSVFDRSMVEVSEPKLAHVTSREPVCRSCNHDPLNQVVDVLRARDRGEASQEAIAQVMDNVIHQDEIIRDILRRLGQRDRVDPGASVPRRIPVRAL